MAIPAGTILTRAEPLEEDELGINKLRVIGPSPVRPVENPHAEWAGVEGDQYIVAPVDIFGANQVAPELALQRDYDASYEEVDEPDEPTPAEVAAKKRALLESPEQVFARQAREERKSGKKTASTSGRVKTAIGSAEKE